MTDTIRKFIDLLESETLDENAFMGADTNLPVDGLAGSVNIRYIANEMLPALTDPRRFVMAFQKIRAGNVENLTRLELVQLALAFISILEMDNMERMKLTRRLASLKAKATD